MLFAFRNAACIIGNWIYTIIPHTNGKKRNEIICKTMAYAHALVALSKGKNNTLEYVRIYDYMKEARSVLIQDKR
jgi:hypothetical protein